MGYGDETWYVGSGISTGYNPCVPVITECIYLISQLHICYKTVNLLSTSSHSQKAAHAVYSGNIASA